jgi:signal transduction histidine kinase
MRERAVQIGGAFNVDSSPTSGTTVSLRVPLLNGRG